MKQPSHTAQNGYTFVEVFVAMMVFAFGFLAIHRLQIASIQNTTHANRVTEATNLAEAKMHELMTSSGVCPTDENECRGCSFCDLNDRDGDATAGLDEVTCASADCAESLNGYTVYVNIELKPAVAGVNAPYKIIRVLVCFQSPNKPNQPCPHKVTLDSIRAQ